MKMFVYIILPCICLLLAVLQPHAAAGDLDLCNEKGITVDESVKKFSLFQVDVAKPIAYNDIGCGILWRDNQCTAIQMTFDNTAKVHDYDSGEEIYAKDAFYVKGADIDTPVGYGIIAFRNRESADRFVAGIGAGTVLSYDELITAGIK